MTTAPARPLMHAYLGEADPMEIVDDSPFGRMEREKAKAIATGEFSGLVEFSKKIRNDAASITAHVRMSASVSLTLVLTPSTPAEFPRLTKPIAMDQTEFPDPELPHPPEQQQQIAAGLDKE